MKPVLTPLLLLLLAGTLQAYPSGAPEGACVHQTPKHGVNKPQDPSTSPFAVQATPNSIPEGGQVTVTVHGTVPFKGVLITARDVHTSEVLQGTFTADHQTKTLNCSGGQSNGLTHTSNVPKSQVITQWTAPAGYKGQVYFSVTVVQAFNTFWKDITSEAVFVQ